MSELSRRALLVFCLGTAAGPAGAERLVAITIDDLPARDAATIDEAEAITEALLGALSRHRATATGFVIGRYVNVEGQAEARARLLHQWLDAGASLGNHTYSHFSFNETPTDAYLSEIGRAEALLPPREGPRFFRAPMNHIGNTREKKEALARYLEAAGLVATPFTVEHADYLFDDAYTAALDSGDAVRASEVRDAYLEHMDTAFEFFEGLSRELFGREIAQVFLIHANALNAAALDAMLSRLEERGYRFVPLENALVDPAYETPDIYVGPAGISWLHRFSLSRGFGKRRTKTGLSLPETLYREPDPPASVLSR